MATRIFFIRHGMCDSVGHRLNGQTPGIHLNQEGNSQAEKLAERLPRVHAIFSSPLERAQETAAAISRKQDIPLQTVPQLTDIDFGEWTGHTIDSLRGDPQWKLFNDFRSFTRTPGGESMREVQERILGFLEGIRESYRDHSVAVVTHCDVIKGAILYALGMTLDNLLRIEIGTASVTTVEVEDWGFRVLGMNDRSHLER